nr:uncharacterized protein LOC110086903 isoform X2 [Pogona vitticeps]
MRGPLRCVQDTYENVKQLQVSVLPTATVQISPEETDNLQDQKTKEEEKTLNDLVGLLQDMVKNIPTEQTQSQLPTELATIMESNVEPSPSVTADTDLMNLKSKNNGMQTEGSQTVALTNGITTPTTAFWKPRSDASASIILQSAITASEKTTPENLRSETSASVLYSDTTTSEKPLVSVSFLLENTTTGGKSFDQLTNGALSSLVESLKNVQKLHETLHTSTDNPQQKNNKEKNLDINLHKPIGADILDLIDALIKTIKNAPSAVKNDPALHNYIEKAESFLKDALELAGEAEKKLRQAKEQGQVKKVELKINPSPSATLLVSEVTSSPPLAKKVEDIQMEMGKLKAFINLLYGFSPHFARYAENSPNKKVVEDIADRAMAVLNAIKSIFCGNPDGRSKQILKQLLKEDMELVKQAMKEKKSVLRKHTYFLIV